MNSKKGDILNGTGTENTHKPYFDKKSQNSALGPCNSPMSTKKEKCKHSALIIRLYGKLLRAEGEIMMLQKELKHAGKKIKKASKFLKSL